MKQFATLFTAEAPLHLECGKTLGPVTVAYETYGRLSKERDNAVFICHALTGDSHVARHVEGDRPGWWDGAIGPGRAFDTDRYFVICANILGGCQGTTGPSSENPATGRPYGLDFPIVTTRDMVRAHVALCRHLGIEQVRAVAGGSLGAMQALEWACTFPDTVRGIIPIAGCGRFHPQGIAYNEVQRQAILADPNFQNGQYYGTGRLPVRGLSIARMLGMITYRSDESMWRQFGRNIRPRHLVLKASATWDDGYGARPQGEEEEEPATDSDLDRGFGIAYEVESYLHYNGDAIVKRFDANSYLYLSRAMDTHDVGRGRPSYAAAHRQVRARALIIGVRSDILYLPAQQRETYELLREAGCQAEYVEMDSPWGHDAFLVDFPLIAPAISRFLHEL